MNEPTLLIKTLAIAVSVLLAAGAVYYRDDIAAWTESATTPQPAVMPGNTGNAASIEIPTASTAPLAGIPVEATARDHDAWAARPASRPDTPGTSTSETTPDETIQQPDSVVRQMIMFSGSKSGPVFPATRHALPDSFLIQQLAKQPVDSLARLRIMMTRSAPVIQPQRADTARTRPRMMGGSKSLAPLIAPTPDTTGTQQHINAPR